LSGSAGGHNGIRSAIAHLGTQDFPRLRVGVGQAQTGLAQQDATSYVLGRFCPQELQVLAPVLQVVVEAVEYSLEQGFEKAMSLFNGRIVAGPSR
ncbi:MAG TPA: aminoacyl-tRNA hydrolase, partial [Candidatus Caenarcaniphilales bacterium]